MAIYHCSIKIGSKSKGQSAIAASAYRSGEKLIDKQTGTVSDYTRKSGIVHSEVSLCANAPEAYSNREVLWNAVHDIEKANNAQLWREFEVALPQELDRTQQINTVRDFVNQLTEQGMCADWSLHDKGDGNPHAHIMATMRSITEDGKWAPKSRKVYDLDENGERIFQKVDKSGRKQYKNHKEDFNDWNKPERVEEWRAKWAECCNDRLSEHDRIDHRSYKRQGIEQEPTVHEGYVARKIERNGDVSERCELNRNIREYNRCTSKMAQIAESLKNIAIIIQNIREEIRKEGLFNGLSELFHRANNRTTKRTVERNSGREGQLTRADDSSTNTDTEAFIREARANLACLDAREEAAREIRQNYAKGNGAVGTSDGDTGVQAVNNFIDETERDIERIKAERYREKLRAEQEKLKLKNGKAPSHSLDRYRIEESPEENRRNDSGYER